MDRARAVYDGSGYAVGIEGGLMEVPGTASGYMEAVVCAIYTGEGFSLGLAPGFEWPEVVTKYMLEHGCTSSEALFATGYAKDERVLDEIGGIGMLTGGVMDRTAYSALAVSMALIKLRQ